MTLKELIKDNYAQFSFLRSGFAYYNVNIPTGEVEEEVNIDARVIHSWPKYDRYQFTIPLDDIGNGTLKANMKAIECMRWIRKALESNELIKV